MSKHLLLAAMLAAAVAATGCRTFEVLTDIGTTAAAAAGYASPDQAASAGRVIKASSKVAEQFTPSQRHYIGRTVGAQVLGKYKVYDNEELTRYVNVLGQTLAAVSDMPETYRGYRFLVLDTDEVNAFAAPGGLVMVTRGLLACCNSEDDLAAVLAHEIGHVEKAHGMKSVRKGRFTQALAIMGTEAARTYTDAEIASLLGHFEGSIADMTDKLFNGYDRGMEYEADWSAIKIMTRLGYNPQGLKNVLLALQERCKDKKRGFGKTHPDPADRLKKIEPDLKGHGPIAAPPERQARFVQAQKSF